MFNRFVKCQPPDFKGAFLFVFTVCLQFTQILPDRFCCFVNCNPLDFLKLRIRFRHAFGKSGLELGGVELRVNAAGGQQLPVGAGFRRAALVQR